ncbi:MAG: hypothetical protein M5U34_23320 [Chloroflexi bacterium]|nr:hypothetical protein [Chloroflexota bacterium]
MRLIVLAEGIIIGWLSFVAGGLLSLPFSRILSQQVGMALLGSSSGLHFFHQRLNHMVRHRHPVGHCGQLRPCPQCLTPHHS